jgi:hypothetical protein
MAQPFTIVKPIVVNDANFVSSSLAEADHAEWAVGTTYALGDRVIITTGQHKIYESLEAGNVGNNPPTSPTKWVEVAPTNRWAVFDQSGGTVSQGTSPVEWVVTTGRVDSVAVLEIADANTVQIVGTSTLEGEVYNETYVLEDSTVVGNWFEYFFSPIRKQSEVIATDIPQYQDLAIKVIIAGAGTVKAGTVIFGNSSQIGATQYGARSGIIDFSRKEVDQFGRATLVKRKFSKRMDVSLVIDNGIIDSVQRLLSDLRAEPVLYIAAKDNFELLTVFGFYRDFSIDIAYQEQSFCTLEIEGLT